MNDSPNVITTSDLFKYRWLHAAKLSPDAKYAVYVVSHIIEKDEDKDIDEDKEYTTLYMVNIETGAHRKLTSGKRKDGNPAWSPDGKTIAFTSNREEDKPQIFLLPVDGGEAQQLTELKQGAGAPVWSPDGKKIAFTAGIDWGKKKPDHSKEPFRVTRNVWRFDAMGELDLAVQNVYVVDVESGEVTQLTDSPTVDNGLAWSPDSTKIAFTSTMHPDVFDLFHGELSVVDLDGNVETVIEQGWAGISQGTWLPDGKRLLVSASLSDNEIGTHPDLYVIHLESGERENRTPDFQMGHYGGLEGRTPTMPPFFAGISDDGQYTYERVQIGGAVHIYRFTLSGEPEKTPLITGKRNNVLFDMQNGKLLYSVDDINNPQDLYVANIDGSGEERLTELNAELLADVPEMEVVELHFKGSDGVDVEGLYVKPNNGAEAPYPTILWIHGGPHGAQGNRYATDTAMLAGAGYGVMFVNHRASTGYGDSFSTAIKGDWGNLDYNDLMLGVDDAIDKGLADPDKLGVCGISGGGNLSSWIVGNTDRFKAAIPQNPVTNWTSFYGVSDIGVWFAVKELGGHPHEIPDIYAKCSPITYAHNCTTPTLMIQCEHDWRCPPEQSEQFYTVLKVNGCTVEMLRQPGSSHGGSVRGPLPVRKSHFEAKLNWFNKYILGIEPEEAGEETQE